jgi:hypothetical protein
MMMSKPRPEAEAATGDSVAAPIKTMKKSSHEAVADLERRLAMLETNQNNNGNAPPLLVATDEEEEGEEKLSTAAATVVKGGKNALLVRYIVLFFLFNASKKSHAHES